MPAKLRRCWFWLPVTPPEACAIAGWLKENRPQDVDRILNRAEEIDALCEAVADEVTSFLKELA